MQVTGKIINIQPDGGYSGQHGYINCFQMTVQGPDGQITGQIGSKSQTYPKAVGQEITVEVTNGQHGTRLKNINPQHQGGGQQQGQQSAQQRQAPQNAGRDYDKENKGKCFCNYVSAMLASGVAPQEIINTLTGDLWTLAGMSLTPPTQGGMNQGQQEQYNQAGPQEDDIPF